MMTPMDKCVVAFNGFLADFVRDINKANKDMKALNRVAYSAISMYSHDEVKLLLERADNFLGVVVSHEGGATSFENFDDLKILSTGTIGEISTRTLDTDTVKRYALILCSLASSYFIGEALDIDKVLEVISQSRESDTLSMARETLGGFADAPVVKNFLTALVDVSSASAEEPTEEGKLPFNLDPGMLDNTTIGSIAKEVVAELDMNQMQGIGSIDDIFKAMGKSGGGGTGDGNNLIGNIVSKVGAKLQDKIANGGLNQQDLIKEAFGMFGPLMGDVLKNMPNNSMKRQTTTKERLKKKLAEKTQH